jgi:hypothetical protein
MQGPFQGETNQRRVVYKAVAQRMALRMKSDLQNAEPHEIMAAFLEFLAIKDKQFFMVRLDRSGKPSSDFKSGRNTFSSHLFDADATAGLALRAQTEQRRRQNQALKKEFAQLEKGHRQRKNSSVRKQSGNLNGMPPLDLKSLGFNPELTEKHTLVSNNRFEMEMRGLFGQYSVLAGHEHLTHMNTTSFTRFLRDAKLLGRSLSLGEATVIFTACCRSQSDNHDSNLSFEEFYHCFRKIALLKYPPAEGNGEHMSIVKCWDQHVRRYCLLVDEAYKEAQEEVMSLEIFKLLSEHHDILTSLFSFYAQLNVKGPTVQQTWAEVKEDNTTISSEEYFTFVKNFDVVPLLTTVGEASRAFAAANIQETSDDKPNELNYPEFLECLVRLSAAAFKHNKRMLSICSSTDLRTPNASEPGTKKLAPLLPEDVKKLDAHIIKLLSDAEKHGSHDINKNWRFFMDGLDLTPRTEVYYGLARTPRARQKLVVSTKYDKYGKEAEKKYQEAAQRDAQRKADFLLQHRQEARQLLMTRHAERTASEEACGLARVAQLTARRMQAKREKFPDTLEGTVMAKIAEAKDVAVKQEIAEAMQELEQFDLQAMTMEGKEATLPAATPDIR